MFSEELKISEMELPVTPANFPEMAISLLTTIIKDGELRNDTVNSLFSVRKNELKSDEKFIFLSPEETGKTRNLPDDRSVYYKLGIHFYYLLTGNYPFIKTDPGDYLYAHVNEIPVPVFKVQPPISKELSAFIDKLLAKDPSERYQSISGMLHDLELIQDHRKNFSLGEKDIPDKIFFSGQIFGRKNQLNTLIQSAKNNVSGIITVQGNPGIGKTSLAQSVADRLGKNILYANSKSELLERNKPFSTFAPILKNILQYILSKKESEYRKFIGEFNKNLGQEGQFLSLVLPEFEIISGKKKTILPPENTKPFLESGLQKLFRLIKKEKKILLFLDDLQWADSASLNLLKSLAEISDSDFIVVAAFRDNEINEHLSALLHFLNQKKILKTSVKLDTLNEQDISEWMSDLLRISEEAALPLASILKIKSNGNPFFIKQIILKLLSENHLYFKNGKWNYDLSGIKNTTLPDDLGIFLTNKIIDLPENTAKLLQTASIFGSVFSTDFLSKIYKSSSQINKLLAEAEKENLIVPYSNSLKENWMFAHDTIRESLYQQLSEEEKSELHFLAGAIVEDDQGSIFKVADHYNLSIGRFKMDSEKLLLAEINFKAGMNAKASGAFELALSYFSKAAEITSKDFVVDDNNFILQILIEKAEAEYLNGNYSEMETICQNLGKKELDLKLKTKVNELLMLAHIAQGRMREAVDLGIDTLKDLGLEIPKSADEQRIGLAFSKVAEAMEGRTISGLRNNAEMSDWKKIAAVRIVMFSGSAAYFAAQDVYPVLVCEQTYLSITYGNSPYASDAYTTYGLLLAAILGDIESGYEFGQLGVAIKEDFNAINLSAKVSTMFNGFVRHWKEPLKNSIEPLKQGYLSGVETGDIEYSCYNLTFLFIHQLFTDQPYENILKEQHGWLRFMQKFNNKQTIEMSIPWVLMAKKFSGIQYITNETENLLSELEKGENPIALCYAYVAEMVQEFHFGNYKKVIDLGEKVTALLEQVVGIFVVPTWHFYLALAYVQDKENKKDIKEHLDKLAGWSQFCPENSLHRAKLIEALVEKDTNKFKEAINHAESSGICLEAGLAHELYGKFLLESKFPIEASGHLLHASHFYRKIHAVKKAELIENQIKSVTGAFTYSSSIDDGLFTELSNTLISKLKIEELVEEILNMVTKFSAATRTLIIVQKDAPIVYAEKIRTGKVVIHKTPLKDYDLAPLNLIRLTFHKGTITNWIQESEMPEYENYYSENNIKSAVALPLTIENHTEAVLVLENDVSQVAFESSSISLFKMLSAPMGISIKNALLYEELLEKESLIQKNLNEKEDLLQSVERQKRSKVASVFEAEENERQRLATELHDNIGQQLSAIKLTLEHLKGNIVSEEKLQKATDLVDTISSDIRNLAHNMLPKSLKEVGLIESLNDLVHKSFSGTKIEYEFETFNLEKARISYILSLTLYRICQELINNVIKHSQAERVNVQLAKNKDMLILFVEDNGSGITQSNTGIGLSNIISRIEIYNGEFSIRDNKPKGTLATVKIPLL